MSESKKLLRGRFRKDAARLVKQFTASVDYDRRLYRQDIAGSITHARMLAKQGIITDEEAETITTGLVAIREEIEHGLLEFDSELEDIHMNIEARLAGKIGDVAGKLHTARSRNDQVALDIRLYMKDAISSALHRLRELQTVLVDLAESNREVVMPGYTHLQRAQPVMFAHHLLAYFEMLERDIGRFLDCLKRTDVLPLGSGALAGVPYPVDRTFLAQELGFGQISQNSMDAVSDRDFVVEYQAVTCIVMMHLSRLAEELILWSSAEFAFVEMDDAYATGSSIMPQKKNPDVAELVRGKTGRVYGNLMGILTVMKGLPLTYNRDLQEDKEGFFDTVDTLAVVLDVFNGMLRTMRVFPDRAEQAAKESYALATDFADYLVRKGLPFRQAYTIVGGLVDHAMAEGLGLDEIDISTLRSFSPLFEEDIRRIDTMASVNARNCIGGTASEQVAAQLVRARDIIEGGYVD